MVKSILSLIISICLFITLSTVEQIFVNKTFNSLEEKVKIVYVKTEDKSAKKDDILALQKLWIDKKEFLHIFIPHNEIKEIDLWLSESCTLVENEKWEDAISKLDVVIELLEQIPKTFDFRIENIM